MSSHGFTDADGRLFEVLIGEHGQITDVLGPWPDHADVDFILEGDLPAHALPDDVPDVVRTRALAQGLEVCYWDDVRCRTCYCDGTGRIVHCSNMC